MKIAKVALTNVALWVLIWTPYATVVMMAAFGDRGTITPLISQLPSMLAKTASCFNPIVFAMAHPKYYYIKVQSSICTLYKVQIVESMIQ